MRKNFITKETVSILFWFGVAAYYCKSCADLKKDLANVEYALESTTKLLARQNKTIEDMKQFNAEREFIN